MNRGQTVYRTVSHVARCRDCGWRGISVDSAANAKTIGVRNSNAATHARVNGHVVIVDIQRVFDRRDCQPRPSTERSAGARKGWQTRRQIASVARAREFWEGAR